MNFALHNRIAAINYLPIRAIENHNTMCGQITSKLNQLNSETSIDGHSLLIVLTSPDGSMFVLDKISDQDDESLYNSIKKPTTPPISSNSMKKTESKTGDFKLLNFFPQLKRV